MYPFCMQTQLTVQNCVLQNAAMQPTLLKEEIMFWSQCRDRHLKHIHFESRAVTTSFIVLLFLLSFSVRTLYK